MHFTLAKHILIVEPDGGPLGALAPRLKELGLVVLRATTVDAARDIVKKSGLLSLVAIDDAVGAESGAGLLATVKEDHPDLPSTSRRCTQTSIACSWSRCTRPISSSSSPARAPT